MTKEPVVLALAGLLSSNPFRPTNGARVAFSRLIQTQGKISLAVLKILTVKDFVLRTRQIEAVKSIIGSKTYCLFVFFSGLAVVLVSIKNFATFSPDPGFVASEYQTGIQIQSDLPPLPFYC